MKRIKNRISFFYITAFIAFLIFLIFIFIDYRLAAAPVLIFAIICIIMPFVPSFGFFLPVISKGKTGKKEVAITFDDGPDPDVTPAVLRLLSERGVKATFFVTGQNAIRYPEIIRDILTQGHDIANHSYSHDPLLMLRGKRRLYDEIKSAQSVLTGLGITPLVFRPPAGITNPMLRTILADLDLICVNWSARAYDAGNRRIERLSEKLLKRIEPDDIILLHDVCPVNKSDIDKLIKEFGNLLDGLKNSGFGIIPLSKLISTEVVKPGGAA